MRTRTCGRQLFGGLGAVARQNFGNRVGEIESAAVGPVSQRLDFANARQALLEQLVFQRQKGLLMGEISYYKASFATIHLHYHSRLQRRETVARHFGDGARLPGRRRVGLHRDRGGGRRLARRHRRRGARRPARACSQNPGNRGKGYSVRHGMLEAKGEWVAVHGCRPFRAHRGAGQALERGRARAAPRWPSARARSTGRWSACTSRSSAEMMGRLSTW